MVETWNELHEGTEIAPTREHGRKYVELTRRYAALWHAGQKLERSGPYAKAQEVSVVLWEQNRNEGLLQREHADGRTQAVLVTGKAARKTVSNGLGGCYIYFDADDSFFCGDSGALEVEALILDNGEGQVVLEYDSTDLSAPHQGAFKSAKPLSLGNTGQWKAYQVKLTDAAFTGRANGSDFRLSVPGGDLVLHRVAVRKVKQ
jgi:hypothetical protein